MNALSIAILAITGFSLAYRFYGGLLGRVFGSEGAEAPTGPTPAHARRDDQDYVPARRHVLMGHHFTSISGAGPIVGPAIAVIWGWIPAVCWVVFGAVFIGAVHDFGCLVASARSQGRSMAELAGEVAGPRARWLMLLLVLFLTWIVLAVFAFVCASLFVDHPATVLPVNFEILVALALGWLSMRTRVSLLWPSLVALALLYGLVLVGVQAPIDTARWGLSPAIEARLDGLIAAQHAAAEADPALAPVDAHAPKALARWISRAHPEDSQVAEALMAARGRAIEAWIIALLGYALVASALPVWLLLQPRDVINSHQLLVGLGGLYLGLIWLHPPVVAPALVPEPPGAPPMWPFLFVTIACGAISGFHGLVSSGTSSKQLDRYEDARAVGYGGMLGEASLALIVVLACVAGFPSSEAWNAHYVSWAAAGGLDRKLEAFLGGGAVFLSGVGVPRDIGLAVIAVIVISFAATTLDTAARIQRFVLGELGEGLGRPGRWLAHPWVGATIACASPLLLLYARTAEGQPLWATIWPTFGSANQLLGALSLAILTVWLVRRWRGWRAAGLLVLIPFLIISLATGAAFALQLSQFWSDCVASDWSQGKLVLSVSALLFTFGAWTSIEAMVALRNAIRAHPSEGC